MLIFWLIFTMLCTGNNVRTVEAVEVSREGNTALYLDVDGEMWYAENDLCQENVTIIFNTMGTSCPYDDEIIIVY